MHLLFADWHRIVEIEPTAETLTTRWQVITTTVDGGLAAEQAVGLVALAHGDNRQGSLDRLARAFKEVEPTFPMVGNARLMAVLAGATIVHALEKSCETATLLAYATVASEACGSVPVVDEVASAARAFIAREGIRAREPKSRPEPLRKYAGLSKGVEEVAAEAASPQNAAFADTAKLQELVKQITTQLNATANAVSSYAAAVSNWAESAVDPLREELNMVWWLLSGASRTADQAWDQMPAGAAALVGAWELADLVTQLPAPPVCSRLLRQLLEVMCEAKEAEIVLYDAVAGIPDSVVRPEPPAAVLHLTPISAHATGRTTMAEGKLSPLDWATRAFTEVMLIRAFEDSST